MSGPAETAPPRIGLSVVIPVHNMAVHVRSTLASLATQTSNDFEVIVVDDGSTDSSAAVVHQVFATGEIPGSQLVHTRHHGVSAARNTGAALAAGAYVLFLDGDDRVFPDLVSAVTQVGGDSPDLICWAGTPSTRLEPFSVGTSTCTLPIPAESQGSPPCGTGLWTGPSARGRPASRTGGRSCSNTASASSKGAPAGRTWSSHTRRWPRPPGRSPRPHPVHLREAARLCQFPPRHPLIRQPRGPGTRLPEPFS
jgi:hypothetical protein